MGSRASRWRCRALRIASQGVNALLLGGSPTETVSGRAWRSAPASPGWARVRRAIDALFFWDEAHCLASHLEDVRFARAVLAADPREVTS